MKVSPELQQKAELLASLHKGTAFELLGAKVTELTPQKVVAEYSLNEVSRQAFGLLHGGVSIYVAESIASIGGWLAIDLNTQICVGTEINASHLKAVSSGKVTAVATTLRQGKTLQVWQVECRDEAQDLVCICRCTLLVRSKLASAAKAE